MPVVVAINMFKDDTPAEIALIREKAIAAGAEDALLCTHWANGGDGAVELAHAVIAACEQPSAFQFLYPLEWSIKAKIEKIAMDIYGAGSVQLHAGGGGPDRAVSRGWASTSCRSAWRRRT